MDTGKVIARRKASIARLDEEIKYLASSPGLKGMLMNREARRRQLVAELEALEALAGEDPRQGSLLPK